MIGRGLLEQLVTEPDLHLELEEIRRGAEGDRRAAREVRQRDRVVRGIRAGGERDQEHGGGCLEGAEYHRGELGGRSYAMGEPDNKTPQFDS